MAKHPESYRITIDNVSRDLRLFEVAPGVHIAILNILGDVELVQAASQALQRKLHNVTFDTIITPAAKGIPLAYQLSADTGKPYVALRKTYKIYMGEPIVAETESITTGERQTLYLDEKDLDLVRNRSVLLVDDVISTGSTLNAMRAIVDNAGGRVAAEAAIFTEGEVRKWQTIISLGNLPVWLDT
ncbi:MAG: phosphoribosyltransferase family protein [Chloroflexota bacterium]